MLAEHTLDRRDFGEVAGRGGGAVGIDVLHLLRIQPGIAQGILHAACGTFAGLRRRGHVVGVAAHAEADQLGIDARATGTGMLELFQHQGAGTVGQHETVAITVPGAAGPRGIVIAGGQRTRRTEAAKTEAAAGHLGTTGDHHVGVAVGDIACRHADAVGARGAGGGDGVVGTLCAQMDRQESGNHVDDRARHEERRNPPRPLLVQRLGVVLDIGQTTDAGAHGHADALAIGIGDFQTGIAHRLETGCQAVLDEEVHLASFLGRQVVLDIEALDRAAKAGIEGRDIHMPDGTDATLPGQHALPTAGHIRAKG
ncbi:hypothetical protein D9M71_307100 [compost metagenome]